MKQRITLKNVAVHNLQGVDLELTPNQLIVFTGVSGSGKSSMAFDTIYVEAMRRYVESLSTQARRHLEDLPKPAIDHASGLSPTITIEQKTIGRSPRSTVGTMTDIYDYLRVLFARVALPHCPISGEVVRPRSREEIINEIQNLPTNSKIALLAPICRNKKGTLKEELELLQRKGFLRLRLNGEMCALDEEISLDSSKSHDLDALVDRITVNKNNDSRIAESVQLALELGNGLAYLLIEGKEQLLSTQAYAAKSGRSYQPLQPHDFSFNSPSGMCEQCHGLGTVEEFDLEKVIDENKSIAEDCCSIASSANTVYHGNIYKNLARIHKFKLSTPWHELNEKTKQIFLFGTEEQWTRMLFTHRQTGKRSVEYIEWKGVLHEAHQRLKATSERYQQRMRRLMTSTTCPSCQGSRLKPYPSVATFAERTISEIARMTVAEAKAFFETVRIAENDLPIADGLLSEIRQRLVFLNNVGLNYLTLDRIAPTLSGGEAQRVRLASQIGCGLVGVTYILDEPSIGLHNSDNERLIATLKALRDRGNTVIVVEHDEETMRAADHIVDFGPKAGSLGGHIVASGTFNDLLAAKESLTGQYLSGHKTLPIPKTRRPIDKKLTLEGASHNNLKQVTVDIPLQALVVVTGVSGSGKSSLISDTLYPALANTLQRAELTVGPHKALHGVNQLDKVIVIDQAPIGRTPRSNPATYIKLFDSIRDLYSQLPESQARGYSVGRFSFNVAEGSCTTCSGMGSLRIDMDFLEDAFVTCPLCNGHRFDQETLQVKYKGHSIYDVLEMTVTEAHQWFENIPTIQRKLQTLEHVGLSYLKLGQSSTTLSGGEAQRIKLSRELSRPTSGKTLYILDEPTTGLHFHDISYLLTVLSELIDQGNSVVVIEHNTDVIKAADWIIDLGPGGGPNGGQILATGTPEALAQQDTTTGRAIKQALNKSEPAQPPKNKEIPPIQEITVTGATQNNLKNVSVAIPRGKITVCTGPSGSGKSSFAFETVYAEGQRRYTESLSPYARQFVKQMPKPKVLSVEGLSPAIAIEQKAHAGNPRSTVGTQTEIYDYLRLLYARAGIAHCPETGEIIRSISKEHIAERILTSHEDTAVVILAPITEPMAIAAERYKRQGYLRLRINGMLHELDNPLPKITGRKTQIQLVVDRLKLRSSNHIRLLEAIGNASTLGQHQVVILHEEGGEQLFNMSFSVESTGKSYPEITPHTFSFNHLDGMCPDCQGLGFQRGIEQLPQDWTPQDVLTLFWPFNKKAIQTATQCLETAGLDTAQPISEMSDAHRQVLFYGTGKAKMETGSALLRWRGINKVLDSISRGGCWQLREATEQGLAEIPCLSCQGDRLHALARHVTLAGVTLGQLCSWPITQALEFLEKIHVEVQESQVLQEVHKQLLVRLRFLCQIGLGYLSLNRAAPSLSNGESQRIRLARQLGTGLTGVLYVLDEPTVGLHPFDNERLNQALHQLKQLGNTLLLVEHDPLTVKQADHLLEFGPKAGKQGGSLIAQGTVKQITKQGTLTGLYLSGKRIIQRRRIKSADVKSYPIHKASARNIQEIELSLPLRQLTCLTGVSGSGKSTLLHEIIKPQVEHHLRQGDCPFSNLIILDQEPIGHTNRSDVGTFTDVAPLIRNLFAKVSAARAKGLKGSHFSTNHVDGMCTRCSGLGYRRISLHFLPSVQVTCDTCQGHRLNPTSLEITYAGISFGKVLGSSIEEALELFGNVPPIRRRTEQLIKIGLGYLKLGQEVASLSGGEAQRLRLSRELAKRSTGNTLYLLDEPTTGLSYTDVEQLLTVLEALVSKGNTLIVVEHNLDLLKNADHIIDLGPGPGADGGRLIAAGTPEEIAACPSSKTGHYLKEELALCAV